MPHYSNTDIQFLQDNLHLSDRQIAEKLGRTQISVAVKRHYLGLEKVKPYTTKDIRYIAANLDLTDAELAEELGRSVLGIYYARHRYNLKKYKNYGKHTTRSKAERA